MIKKILLATTLISLLAGLIITSPAKIAYAKDLKPYQSKINQVRTYWGNILNDQQKLLSIVRGIRDSKQLAAKKKEIIKLLNNIDYNAKYRRSIMKKLPAENQVRSGIAKMFNSQKRKYKQNEKEYYLNRRRIKKIPGCQNMVKEIDTRHNANKKYLIQKLTREGKMWPKVKKKRKKFK